MYMMIFDNSCLSGPLVLFVCLFVFRPGDVLESVNGVSLNNAHHRDAVRAVKESKRSLTIVRGGLHRLKLTRSLAGMGGWGLVVK